MGAVITGVDSNWRRLYLSTLPHPLRIGVFQLRSIFYLDVDALWDALQDEVRDPSEYLTKTKRVAAARVHNIGEGAGREQEEMEGGTV